jgi:hypothetical protein
VDDGDDGDDADHPDEEDPSLQDAGIVPRDPDLLEPPSEPSEGNCP